MFEDFVVTSKKKKIDEIIAAINAEVLDWRNDLDDDLRDYLNLAELSEHHRHYTLQVIYAEVVIPMLKDKYILLRDDTLPVAYASWGFFNKRIADNKLRLRSAMLEWNDYDSGEEIWLLDVIAPHGHTKQIINMLVAKKHELGLHDARINFRRTYPNKRSHRFNDAIC